VAGEGFPGGNVLPRSRRSQETAEEVVSGGKVFAWPARVFPAATSYQGAAEVKKLLKK